MKRKYVSLFISLFLFRSLLPLYGQHKFTVDLTDIADDQFKVTLIPDRLTEQNNIFQFASIAPGTYQINDIGRFVRQFKAYDENGYVLGVKRISTNQWKLSDPVNTARIEYAIAETWDTPVDEHVVYGMCGTSLEEDHALINNHTILGYLHGMQSHEIWIQILHPATWTTGTALTKNDDGYFTAPTYDFVVDSPILLGRLSVASTVVEGTQVDIFTYSKTDLIKSEDILKDLEDILYAASKFTRGLPVDRYVFLYHFEDADHGAWEHSFSSVYAMKETEFDAWRTRSFRSIAAHEFYHVVTPLNIHSELIEQFNYITPELSQHLWLYEGVTEWAAITMLLRGNIITLDEYLFEITTKLLINDGFDPNLSLTELGVNATHLQDQYINIYNKGAVTAALLDILLLKKSKGKKGLCELVNELAMKYGPNKPFNELLFFHELEEITYPEVGVFINNYIKGSEPLPVKDYFDYIGIDYEAFAGYDSSKVSMGIGLTVVGNNIVISNVNDEIKELQIGDILHKFNGTEITLMNIQEEFGTFRQKKVGDTISTTFLRDKETIDVNLVLHAKTIRHQLEVIDKPKRKQLKLRDRWLRNL
jgi:predicted metalloprotease with PDZ domain